MLAPSRLEKRAGSRSRSEDMFETAPHNGWEHDDETGGHVGQQGLGKTRNILPKCSRVATKRAKLADWRDDAI